MWWWIVIGLLMFVFGFMIVIYNLKTPKKKRVTLNANPTTSKDGLPITARNERVFIDAHPENDDKLPDPVVVADQAIANKITISSAPPVSSDTLTPATNTADPLHELATAASQPTNQPTDTPATPNTATSRPETPVSQNSFDGRVADFTEETPLLDGYFADKAQSTARNNDALLGYKNTLTIVLTPRDHLGIDGTSILRLAERYGLRYGLLNMFHRYERPEGAGMLWFSMLGVGTHGIEGFDLVQLPTQSYRGLAFFLSLPHPEGLVGFDSMIQIAFDIAETLDADIHNEDGYFLDDNELQTLRHYVATYTA